MAFNSAGLGLAHAMAHQPGATHDLSHGVCNAILFPIVCRFNTISASKHYREIARALGGNIDGLDEQSAALLTVDLIKELS
ncbi:alcohol dehydrogenase [Vibrio variabilis]|uniref:Alcohol dehydrogenase n=1 Tax=Vibrio variabilis TaxID=990271 RepID=A0ABQ0JHF7_9VIBR|nr:alcohol dehydrogenase [Vibrio variabilis]